MNMSPLEQFKIYETPENCVLVTNMVIILILGNLIYNILIWLSSVEGSRWKIIKISIISTIRGLINYKMEKLAIIYTIFSIILVSNILGLIPYGFTPTSHISLTLNISLTIMIGITIIGNKSIFSLFIPSGTPIYLIPLIVVIELISYISRVFSLALRLTANISAGHCVIYTIALLGKSIIISSIFLTIMFILEIVVGVLQAYVFTLLISSYLKDVIRQ